MIPAAKRVSVQGAPHVRQESSWRHEGEEGDHEVTDLTLNARFPVRSRHCSGPMFPGKKQRPRCHRRVHRVGLVANEFDPAAEASQKQTSDIANTHPLGPPEGPRMRPTVGS